MNKKILIISYYFPPIKAIGGIRTYYFSKYLNINNWNVFIFTTSAYKILNKDSFLPKILNAKYIYIPTIDIQSLIVFFSYRKKNRKKKLFQEKPNNKIGNTTLSQKIRNSLPFNISYEGGFIYIFFGVLMGLYNIKKNDIKYIYSTYSPNSNHIIAYILKLINPKLVWTADFRDLPLGDSETKIFFKKTQNYLNSKIYAKANSLIVVSDGIKNKMLKYNSNIQVINNGFDNKVNDLTSRNLPKGQYFNIVYTGSLYGGKRDPELLFAVIKKLLSENKVTHDLRLIYAGKDGQVWDYLVNKYELGRVSENLGLLSMKEVQKIQADASLFLMVTWSTNYETGVLTGKFFEYLQYLKPIICLINGNKDEEIEKKFISINCGSVIYKQDKNKLSNFIIENFNEWKLEKSINTKYNLNELESYTSESLTKQLEKILINKDYHNE